MGEPTVVVYGSVENESLAGIYRALESRGRRRAVFVVQEQFPTRTGLYLPMDQPGGLLLPEGLDPIALDDVVSVCLPGYYVSDRGIEDFSPEDQRYIQAESWAALIALFRHLSNRCLVANHLTRRDLLSNRWAELSYLASCGLRVPRMLVTSDPDQARAFCQGLQRGAVFKPVSSVGAVFHELAEPDLARLARITAAPVHFEEKSDAEVTRVVVIGDRMELFPRDPAPPSGVLAALARACRQLDLYLAEATLRQEQEWTASGLFPFLSADILAEPAVIEPVAELLEGA